MARRARTGAPTRARTGARTRVLVLHGPNLNLLGEREPEIYGTLTLGEINARIREAAAALSVSVEIRQSNSEGALVDAIHAARRSAAGIILNPGAYSHSSLALADALRSVNVPAIEVHISNVFAREAYRHQLVTAPACRAVLSGLGWRGYVVALEELVRMAGTAATAPVKPRPAR